MFNNNPTTNNSRLMAVEEQAFDPIRVPIVIGNEVYLMSQQDIRNIIDTRYITWQKMPGNNPGNCPVQGQAPSNMNNILKTYPQLNPQSVNPFQAPNMLLPGQSITYNSPPNQAVNPLGTQLDWEMRAVDENRPNRLCYSKQTSTSDLKKIKFCIPRNSEFHLCPKYKNRGLNVAEDDFAEECPTDSNAYELLKQKKMSK